MKIGLILTKSFINKINFIGRSKCVMHCRNMASAYLRFEDGSERFQFSFNFQYKNVNRQFNFSRLSSETVQEFLNRVSNNVCKIVEQKKKKKKRNNEQGCDSGETAEKIEVQLLKDGIPVPPELKCCETLHQDGLKLLVCETLYDIEVNAPWVNTIVLPDSILAGFPVYPSKLEMEFASREDSSFEWFKSIDDKKNLTWMKTGDGYFYTPSTGDIGLRLQVRCIPRRRVMEGDIVREGPQVEAISPTVVEAGPGKCPFEVRHAFTPARLQSPSFRVVTYNLLADTYVDSDYSRTVLYPYCPPYALAINYRKQLFLKEIIGYNADLMCLQEVDAKVFEFDLIPVLSSLGFDGVFQRKGDGKVHEGLACFFHKSKFKLIKSCSLTLGKEMQSNQVFSKICALLKESRYGQFILEKMADLPTTVQVTVLEVVEEGDAKGQHLVVGTTHLYFHPMADSIRLLQTGMVLAYLEHIVQELSNSSNQKTTLMFCGDFNSTPDTGAYRLVTSGKVDANDPSWFISRMMEEACQSDEDSWNLHGLREEEMKGVTLMHQFSLASAYQELDFTNYTSGFVGCLDYIFYSKDALKVQQVVPLPSEEEVTQNTALPSIVFPSDHIALVADLSWNLC